MHQEQTITFDPEGGGAAVAATNKMEICIIFGLEFLTNMMMSQASTYAFACMLNSGTAPCSGEMAQWQLAGGGAHPMAFKEVFTLFQFVVSFVSRFCKHWG
jgi:hypothetical protein